MVHPSIPIIINASLGPCIVQVLLGFLARTRAVVRQQALCDLILLLSQVLLDKRLRTIWFSGFSPEIQDHNLVLNVLCVPSLFDSGSDLSFSFHVSISAACLYVSASRISSLSVRKHFLFPHVLSRSSRAPSLTLFHHPHAHPLASSFRALYINKSGDTAPCQRHSGHPL